MLSGPCGCSHNPALLDIPCLSHFLKTLLQRDALNLNLTSLGKLLHGNAASSWLVGEMLLIDTIHLREVGHVSYKDLKIINIGLLTVIVESSYVDLHHFFHA
jgi:hypothetical protein